MPNIGQKTYDKNEKRIENSNLGNINIFIKEVPMKFMFKDLNTLR